MIGLPGEGPDDVLKTAADEDISHAGAEAGFTVLVGVEVDELQLVPEHLHRSGRRDHRVLQRVMVSVRVFRAGVE